MIGELQNGITEQELDYLCLYCEEYYAWKHNKEGKNGKEIIEKTVKNVKCTRKSASQYLNLYAAMVDKKSLPKNLVGSKIFIRLIDEVIGKYEKDIIVSAIANAYVLFQYQYHNGNKNIKVRKIMQKYSEKYNVGLDFSDRMFGEIPKEVVIKEIEFLNDIPSIKINEVDPPKKITFVNEQSKIRRSLTAKETAEKEYKRKKKGTRGEEIVLKLEKERLEKLGRSDLASKVKYVAQICDGLGYDIESFEINGDGVVCNTYIEVKTTEGNVDQPFYVTRREIEISEEKGDAYRIYRVFNLTKNSSQVYYYILKGSIAKNFELEPLIYITK